MHDLEITWPTGSARFTPEDSPIEIGRSPDAAIILTEPSVSRSHISFVWTGTAWVANDSSTHGSFDPIGVRLAPQWTVGTDTTVRVGGVEGVEVRINLVTTHAGSSPAFGSPPPPEVASPPPGPPGLGDVAPAPLDPGPGPFDAPAPPPPGFDVPAAPPAGFDPAPPPAPPAGFDPAPPPGFDPAPPPAPPAGFDPAPPPGLDAPAPPGFDAPAAPESDPAPPPAGFGEPPAPPTGFDAPPPSFDQAPPIPTPGPPGDQAPSIFDAPPSQAAADFQASPILGADATDFAPPQGVPSALDDVPAPPAPGSLDFDATPAAQAPAPQPPGFDQPGAPPDLNQEPPSSWSPQGAAEAEAASVHDLASTTAISDSTIQLSVDGRDYTFLPGTEVTVGRDPSCLVTLDERHSLVSRRHLKIAYSDNTWWIEDFSSKGTFIDGRQLSGRYKAEGAFMAQLGDDDAGTPMRVITSGEHRSPRRQSLGLLIAIGLLALVAIGALAFALGGRGDSDGGEISAAAAPGVGATASEQTLPPSTAASDLAAAKQSTVLLIGDDGVGSGFFVDDNLILTNQHVAVLGESLFVAVSRQADEPAEVEFLAETFALHPYLDIAVLRLTTDSLGESVDRADLPSVKIGSSGDLTIGDSVYNTGFPANLSVISRDDMGEILLPPVSANSGQAASFSIWPGCSNPDQASFIPEGSPPGVACAQDGDIRKGIVLTTFASGQGASGSPVYSGDEVVAVVFAGPIDEANAGQNITTDAFSEWLTGVIESNG